ncbi:MAG: hypothetical protein WKF77_17965 [Planctomycetaceae bacterium]
MTALPFSHLNLRRNPFGELTAVERTALALVESGDALRHLALPRSVVQVIGEKGFGKTTHLLALAAHFADNAYIHIPEGQRAAIPETGEPLLIDEAQRLTLAQRWQTFRSDRRLILGTHTDFESVLRRAGRPILTIAANQFTNELRVHTLLNARIQSARRDDGPIPSITLSTASKLLAQFGSDIRSMEHSMYDTFQQLRNIQDV